MHTVYVIGFRLQAGVIGCQGGVNIILMQLEQMSRRIKNVVGVLGTVIGTGDKMVFKAVVELQ